MFNAAQVLPAGPGESDDDLFPLQDRLWLRDKSASYFARVTPRAMRRTFQDLARRAQVHDLVTRAISGHATDRMQRHYSTAQREEMLSAVDKVVSLFADEREPASRPGAP